MTLERALAMASLGNYNVDVLIQYTFICKKKEKKEGMRNGVLFIHQYYLTLNLISGQRENNTRKYKKKSLAYFPI